MCESGIRQRTVAVYSLNMNRGKDVTLNGLLPFYTLSLLTLLHQNVPTPKASVSANFFSGHAYNSCRVLWFMRFWLLTSHTIKKYKVYPPTGFGVT